MDGTMNGCHNRPPYRETIAVQDGYHQDTATRVPKMIDIPSFAHGAGCQYTLSQLGRDDPKCSWCMWKVVEK